LAGAHLALAELAVRRHDLADTEIHVGRAMTLGDQLGAPTISIQARFHAAAARLVCTAEGWAELDEVRRLAVDSSPEEHVGQIAAVIVYVANPRPASRDPRQSHRLTRRELEVWPLGVVQVKCPGRVCSRW